MFNLTRLQIRAGFLRRRRLEKIFLEPGGRLGVQSQQAFAQRVAVVVLDTASLLDDGNSGALGEAPDR